MVFPLILVLGHRVWGEIAQFFGARGLDMIYIGYAHPGTRLGLLVGYQSSI